MKIETTSAKGSTMAACVAPEDLKRGDRVAILTEVVEFPSFYWFEGSLGERDELVRVRCIPAGSGLPLKVKAICLPFVLVKTPSGDRETVDVRKVQLVRLNKGYAKEVIRYHRKQAARLNRERTIGR
jgi:hypothetical protein